MPEMRLRLEWVEDRAMSCASLGDYRVGVGHAFDGERTTYGWSTWVASHSSFAGGDGLTTRDEAKAAAEAALTRRLEAYRPLLCDSQRKAMPDADLLFNAAHLLRGTWDDKCVAMASSLERAAAGILAQGADDDDRQLDALVELVRRA